MKVNIEPFVTDAVARIYDRYVEVTKAEAKKEPMSLTDFHNLLIIKGLHKAHWQIARSETRLGIT